MEYLAYTESKGKAFVSLNFEVLKGDKDSLVIDYQNNKCLIVNRLTNNGTILYPVKIKKIYEYDSASDASRAAYGCARKRELTGTGSASGKRKRSKRKNSEVLDLEVTLRTSVLSRKP